MEDWKTKLSVLWLMSAVSMVVTLLLALFESGDLTHIVPSFAVDTWSLLLFTVWILVPLVMAFLSLSLNDKANRWLNIVVGAFYSVGAIVVLVTSLMDNPSVLAILTAFGSLFSALIVWYAWKSKQKT